MIYRSDKFLRQDIFFACCLHSVCLQGIQGRMLPLDKVAQLEDEDEKNLFIFLHDLKKYGIEEPTVGGTLSLFIDYHCKKYLENFLLKSEIDKKFLKLAIQATQLRIELFREIFKDVVNSHKFILILYQIVTELSEQGCYIPSFYEELFRPFLETEALQNTNSIRKTTLTNEDWLKMKKSADKQAKKYVEVLKSKGYFVN